jgi:hypothetical protein
MTVLFQVAFMTIVVDVCRADMNVPLEVDLDA